MNLDDFLMDIDNIELDFRSYNLNKIVIDNLKGNNILDIGCGSGKLLKMMNQVGKRTCGIEKSRKLVEASVNKNPESLIIEGDVSIVKDIEYKAECITMLDVLEHINDDIGILKEIYYYLPVNGRLVVVVPAFQFLYGIRDKNIGHFRRYSKNELLKKITEAGFCIKKVRFWNMLGVIPYFISEKVLKKELKSTGRNKKSLFNSIMHLWFEYVENKVNFGFGLSLICIAEKG